jgi:hypothetical protein
MAQDSNTPGSHKRRRSDTSMGRSMDLHWSESFADSATSPAASADVELVIEVVPERVQQAAASPVETAAPVVEAGPFIEAVLVDPPTVAAPAPFIEAVLVAPGAVPDGPGINVADWLGDVLPPGPVVPPAPPINAIPDWVAQLADSEATAPPTPPPTANARPDWLDQLG